MERHISEYGVTKFAVGQHSKFDWMVGRIVAEAKKQHPEVILTLLLPYHPGTRTVEL